MIVLPAPSARARAAFDLRCQRLTADAIAHVTRPVRSTPCALPHFTKAGDPKTVPGLLYRKGSDTQVLCAMHGKQVYGL